MGASADHVDPEVFAFLADPASHGADCSPVEVIETHAACVFLAGGRALKIKKAVRFAYLDFSRRAAREAALAREIELNAPNAPTLYRGLDWVTRTPSGRLALGGAGARTEPVLVMRRFDQACLLARMAERGALDVDMMVPLAAAIRQAHERAPVAPGEDAQAGLERVLRAVLAQCLASGVFDAARLAALEAGGGACLARLAPLLAERARQGHIRRCHGDLHLENIVLLDGRPVLFDALEFDERLARIDVLYDLAFALMDLVQRGLGGQANRLMSAYLAGETAQGLAGLAGLGLMMALRAGVRAQVGADRAGAIAAGPAREAAREAARAHLDLAVRLIAPPVPRLVAVGGLSGTGKSTLAAAIAAQMAGPAGGVHLRSDTERKAMAGVGERDRLSPSHYTPAATRAVYQRLAEKAATALAAGLPVIVDAVHARPVERAAIEAVARHAGVAFAGLWLEAPAQVLRTRVTARRGDASDADIAVLERQLGYNLGALSWSAVDAAGAPGQTLENARRAMAAPDAPRDVED